MPEALVRERRPGDRFDEGVSGAVNARRQVAPRLARRSCGPCEGQVTPPLTSVRLPVDELGRHAVELLVGKLEGRAVPPLLLLPPRLSRRISTPELAATRYGAASSG